MDQLRMFGAVLSLAVAACAGTMVRAETPRVAVDIAPLHGLVARVMGDLGSPELILPPAASPHDYALRPTEARALHRADLVFWVSAGLTPWLERTLGTLPPEHVTAPMMTRAGTTTHALREVALFADAGHDDHDHDHNHDNDHDRDAGVDPHGWLDPNNAIVWLALIAEDLAAADPDNAVAYRANATAGQAEIATTRADVAAQLRAVSGVSYVVFHDAYRYFEDRFGLEPLGAISLSSAAGPGPAHLQALRREIADSGAVCIFAEPQFSSALVATVAEGSGARSAVLDPMGQGIPPGPDFYPALLRSLADAIAGCA